MNFKDLIDPFKLVCFFFLAVVGFSIVLCAMLLLFANFARDWVDLTGPGYTHILRRQVLLRFSRAGFI
jgi:hypothetical protein